MIRLRRKPASRPRDVDALLRRRLELLERIDATGSIAAAAKAVGLSYKAAWQAVETLNAECSAPLVERAAGGAGGGGTRLTRAGRALVAAFRKADAERLKFLRGLEGRPGDLAPLMGWLRRLSMRTSARNQLFGRVASVRRGEIDAEVVLALDAGDRLAAVITGDSLDRLDLRRGDEAFALIKAPWVAVSAGPRPRAGAAGVFAATVENLNLGPDSAEARLRLAGGTPLIAVLPRRRAEDLELAPGRRVWAAVDPAGVILGVLG